MSEPFIGQLMLAGFNFAPTGWATCDGQILSIAQNTALFSLLGTTFGGNGVSTFALPDLRGRVPIHQGQGPGLQPYVMGQSAGTEAVTLTSGNLPQHTHNVNVINGDNGSTSHPSGKLLASTGGPSIYGSGSPDATLSGNAVSVTGGNQPFDNHSPYLVLNWCIALVGIFPPRS